jgi:serine/threonine protein kinase
MMFLMMEDSFRAKLCDFGCSKLNEHTRAHTKNQGSPAYMAPESRVARALPSPTWDIYAFGVVMYEVFCCLSLSSHVSRTSYSSMN